MVRVINNSKRSLINRKRKTYETNHSRKGLDDDRTAGWKLLVVRTRLESEPSAEPAVAPARAVSRSAPTIFASGRVDYRNVAALAQVKRAGGGVPCCSGAIGRLLDTTVLCSVSVAFFDVVGGKAWSRATHRRRDGLSEPDCRRRFSPDYGRSVSAVA